MKRLIGLLSGLILLSIGGMSLAATVTLTWIGNTESDLRGYRVYRGNGVCATGPLAPLMNGANQVEIAKPATTWIDTTVPVFDGTVCYEITAVDTSGNESPRSNRATKTVNLVPPVAPTGLVIGTVTP